MTPTSLLVELRQAWPSGRRWLPAAIVAGALFAGALFWQSTGGGFSPGDRVPLVAGRQFTAAEYRAAQSAWRAEGLAAAMYSRGVISVPADDAPRYRAAWSGTTEAAARPRWADSWQSAQQRLSQFSGSRERADAKEISRAQVISRLLEELPDIASADVVWDESPATGWRTPPRARAAVYLRAAEGRVISLEVVDAVRRAVAGSKANLAAEDIVVMDQSRMIAYDGAASSPAAARIGQLTALLRTRIEGAFQHLPGLQVAVHADPLAPTGDRQVASFGDGPASLRSSLASNVAPDGTANVTANVTPYGAANIAAEGSVALSPDRAAAPQPTPVTVVVTLPEAAIRQLAGLAPPADDNADVASATSTASPPATASTGTASTAGLSTGAPPTSRAREVFRAVEQHLQQAIRHQTPLLVPAGLSLAADRLHIETIPAPPALPMINRPARSTAAGVWPPLSEQLLPALALLCGLGAIWSWRSAGRPIAMPLALSETANVEAPMTAPMFDLPPPSQSATEARSQPADHGAASSMTSAPRPDAAPGPHGSSGSKPTHGHGEPLDLIPRRVPALSAAPPDSDGEHDSSDRSDDGAEILTDEVAERAVDPDRAVCDSAASSAVQLTVAAAPPSAMRAPVERSELSATPHGLTEAAVDASTTRSQQQPPAPRPAAAGTPLDDSSAELLPTDLLHEVLARLQRQYPAFDAIGRGTAEPAAERGPAEGAPAAVSRTADRSRRATTSLSPSSPASSSPMASPLMASPPPSRPVVAATRLRLPTEDLEGLADEPAGLLREVVRSVDVETWSQALFGTSRRLQAEVLPHLEHPDEERLSRALRSARPVRIREIDAAQAQVREVWRRVRQNLPGDAGEPAHSAASRRAA